MSWEIVWEISDVSYTILALSLAPVLFAIIGLILIVVGERLLIGGILVVVGIVATLFFTTGTVFRYFQVQHSIENQTYGIAEGFVENFKPGREYNDPPRDEQDLSHYESFTVSGVRFRYHHRELCWCYNQTARVGGDIREGLYVRIWHLDGDILRLEIRR